MSPASEVTLHGLPTKYLQPTGVHMFARQAQQMPRWTSETRAQEAVGSFPWFLLKRVRLPNPSGPRPQASGPAAEADAWGALKPPLGKGFFFPREFLTFLRLCPLSKSCAG